MTAEQFAKARQIFLHARELSPEHQEEYLDAACADDPTLKTDIREMLQTEKDNLSFESPILSDASILSVVTQVTSGDAAPRSGTLGNYQIGKRIGRGGMGDVYEAQQKNPRRVVAIKLLHAGLISPEQSKRLAMEAEVLGRLNHPAIAHVYEAGINAAEPFFAMELVQGKDLDKYASDNNLSIQQRLELIAKVCDGVQHAHERGIIHRDLKPSNILVDQNGQPKILDFGIARSIQTDVQSAQTIPGSVIGTPAYMSPEQARGDGAEIGTRSDVYSIGVCAYRLLTGKMPYPLEGKDFVQALKMIDQTPPLRPGLVDPLMRGDIETILLKVLAKDVKQRYASAAEFAVDIRRFLRHQTIFARPQSTWYQMARFARRNRALVGVLALTVAVLISGIVTTSLWAVRAHKAETDKGHALDESRLQLAQLAANRGEWVTAVRAYKEAIAAGTADPIEARLRLIRAMHSGGDKVGALGELKALLAGYPQSTKRAEVIFWKGTAAWLTDNEEAAKLLNQSTATGHSHDLVPADREYATGLLSNDLEAAVTHFRAALNEDRFYYDCYPSLVGSLLLLGRTDQALDICHDWELLYPRDPMVNVAKSVIYALIHKPQESDAAFARLKDRLDPSAYKRVALVRDIIHRIETINPRTVGWTETIGLVSDVWAQIQEAKLNDAASEFEIRFPLAAKALIDSGKSLILANTNPFNLFRDDSKEQLQALQKMSDAMPLASLNLALGQRLVQKGDHEHAAYYLRRAASMPSLLTSPDTTADAYAWLLAEQAIVIDIMAKNNPKPGQVTQAISEYQKNVAWPAIQARAILHTFHSNRLTIINDCISLGLEGEARIMLAQWLEEDRKESNASAQLAKARIELRLGNFGQSLIDAENAVELAKKQNQKDVVTRAQEAREDAIKSIGKVGPAYDAHPLEEFLQRKPRP